jgi:hypothetical protein
MSEQLTSGTCHLNQDLLLYKEAIKAKFSSEGRPFNRGDFDKRRLRCSLRHLSTVLAKILVLMWATSDLPSILLVDELLTTYPDTKVILPVRDLYK